MTDAERNLINEVAGLTDRGYSLTRRYGLHFPSGKFVIRVSVLRDGWADQSRAVVEVLSAGMTWTELDDEPPSNWHDDTPYRATDTDMVCAALGAVSDVGRIAA